MKDLRTPKRNQKNTRGAEVNPIAKWMTATAHACLASALSLVLFSTALPGEKVEARSVSYQLDIPAESLDAALQALALATHHKLLYRAELVSGKSSHGLTGTYTTEEAVRQLLADTGLEFKITPASVVLIKIKNDGKSGDALGGIPATATPAAQTTGSDSADSSSNSGNSGDRLRLAQGDQALSSGGSAVNNPKSSEKSSAQLDEVVVTGRYEFLSADTSGTTNLPLPIEQVPQSISLVSDDFIKAADLKTLGEIGEYTPGAVNTGTPEGEASGISLRGFAAGHATDGIPLFAGSSYEPDYAIYDRLEVVKGPSSVVYGISTPGGLVNFVTKSATADTVNYLSLQAGSWNNFRMVGQLAGALDADGRVRAIGIVVQDQGDSFFNQLFHKKTSVYGGINFDFSDSITGYLHGGYERLERPSNDGFLTEADGSPPPVQRSFCFCSENVVETDNVYHTEGNLTWHATDMLELSLKGNYLKDTLGGAEDYPTGLQANGSFGLDVFEFTKVVGDTYGLGASSLYKFDNWGLKDSFVSMAVLYQSYSTITNGLGSPFGTANIFDGQAAVSRSFDTLLAGPLPYPFDQAVQGSTTTESVQSIVKPLDPLSILLGASYSKPDETVTTTGVGSPTGIPQTFSFKGQVSYRAGLTYEFLPKTNAYLSFSQSYSPQPFLETGNKPLPSLTGDQYEGGLKYRSSNGRFLLTGALFQITESNVAQYVTTNEAGISYYAPIGKVQHRGFELQALGQITPQWQINAGYMYLDPKIVGAAEDQAALVGEKQLYVPMETFSVYSTYSLNAGSLRGLSFGGGVRYVSAQATSYRNPLANTESNGAPVPWTPDLPGYAVVDATVSYAINKWLVQLNAHNILNKVYFINEYQSLAYGNTPGDPTNFALTLHRTF